MTLQEQRDVIQAAIDGKPIELTEVEKQDWRPCKPQLFNFGCYDYRVKVEPREWTIWVDPDGVISEFGNHSGKGCATRIKVREVLE